MSLREDRIAALEEKLAARDGKPGFGVNTNAIREQIAALREGLTRYRSEITGRYVDLAYFIDNPNTTEEA